MIRIRQIKLNIDENENNLKQKISQKLKIKENDILSYKINKKSIDARKEIMYVYEIDAEIKNENIILKKHLNDIIKTPDETYKLPKPGNKK